MKRSGPLRQGRVYPSSSNAFDCAVAHHVFEHVGVVKRSRPLARLTVFLKRGGSLIVCVPDLRALAERWLSGAWIVTSTASTYTVHTWEAKRIGIDGGTYAKL